MKIVWNIMIVVGLFSMSGCNQLEGIPVIGFDSNNNPAQVWVPEKEYSNRVSSAADSLQESALPVLAKRSADSPWGLRTVVVGLGVNTQIGIGPFQIGALPRFRVVFSNSTDPTNIP